MYTPYVILYVPSNNPQVQCTMTLKMTRTPSLNHKGYSSPTKFKRHAVIQRLARFNLQSGTLSVRDRVSKQSSHEEMFEGMTHEQTVIGFENQRKQNRIKTSYGATAVLQTTTKSFSTTTRARHRTHHKRYKNESG